MEDILLIAGVSIVCWGLVMDIRRYIALRKELKNIHNPESYDLRDFQMATGFWKDGYFMVTAIGIVMIVVWAID